MFVWAVKMGSGSSKKSKPVTSPSTALPIITTTSSGTAPTQQPMAKPSSPSKSSTPPSAATSSSSQAKQPESVTISAGATQLSTKVSVGRQDSQEPSKKPTAPPPTEDADRTLILTLTPTSTAQQQGGGDKDFGSTGLMAASGDAKSRTG